MDPRLALLSALQGASGQIGLGLPTPLFELPAQLQQRRPARGPGILTPPQVARLRAQQNPHHSLASGVGSLPEFRSMPVRRGYAPPGAVARRPRRRLSFPGE